MNSKIPPVTPVRSAYRRALSASVVEHAKYLATLGEKRYTQHLISRRKAEWQQMEARRALLHDRVNAVDKPD